MLNVTDDVRMQADDEAGGDEDQLVEQLLAQTNSPEKFVELAWPEITPERWQREVLETIGEQLRENAKTGRSKPVQLAVASGNGVGKTALLSWVVLWSLMTFENTLGVCTAGTEPQVRTRLWGELSKWYQKLPEALRGQFEMTATCIFNKAHERTWRVDGRPWSERNQEAFSGLHNQGLRVVVIFDEASMIPQPIWNATSGMLNDSGTQTLWLVFGNPIRVSGPFREVHAGGRLSAFWHSIRVDSRSVSLTDQASLEEKVSFYGASSNYVKSHILGEFPTQDAEGLIPGDWVAEAATRETFQHPADAIVLGVDVASGHGADVSCIVVRQGLDARTHGIRRYPTLNPLELAFKVAAVASEVGADATFIDANGLGEATVAQCRALGMVVHGVYFQGRPDNPSAIAGRAANKRAECWLAMREWLRSGSIPNDDGLKQELVGPRYTEAAGGILIERKQDMASRGLGSPDVADSLALTFSSPVWTAQASGLAGRGDWQVTSEYNHFGNAEIQALMAGKQLPQLTRKYVHPDYPLKAEFDPDSDRDGWTRGGWSGEGDEDAGAG
jgi:hypothetical protein